MIQSIIYLVRHGTIRSNIKKIYAGWSNEELIKEGIVQAEKIGRVMQDWDISTIYSSPIKRAIQTAKILNKHINADVIIDSDLREMEMGAWEGLSENQIAATYQKEYKIWLERPAELKIDKRETLHEVQKRALMVINKILEQESGAVSLVVTHVALIRCIFLHYENLFLNSYKTITVPNLSVFRLVFNNTGISIERAM